MVSAAPKPMPRMLRANPQGVLRHHFHGVGAAGQEYRHRPRHRVKAVPKPCQSRVKAAQSGAKAVSLPEPRDLAHDTCSAGALVHRFAGTPRCRPPRATLRLRLDEIEHLLAERLTSIAGILWNPLVHPPFEFTVPDLLYERERREHGGPEFVRSGLCAEELDGEGVALARHCLRRRRSLSLPDSFALALAKTNAWTLCTGDRERRELAEEDRVRCHGVAGLLDQMFEHRVIEREGLCTGPGRIVAHPRCRLPKSEVRRRLVTWPGRCAVTAAGC